MTNTPKQVVQVKVAQRHYKNVCIMLAGYTTIMDPLRTVSWNKNSHPTGVDNIRFEDPIFQLPATVVQSKDKHLKIYE